MKSKDGVFWNYAPVLGVLAAMAFIFLYSTLPSLEQNRYLNRVREARKQEIRDLKDEEGRFVRRNHALEEDPTTIERHLRRRFEHAFKVDEAEIDMQQLDAVGGDGTQAD